MENPPFEDVFPIQDGDFPLLCLYCLFTGGYEQQKPSKTRMINISIPSLKLTANTPKNQRLVS